MPGLIGFTDRNHIHGETMLLNMRKLLKHFDSYVDEELYSDEDVYASRTHLGIVKQGKQPYVYNNRLLSWLEGEFYNRDELRSKYCVASATDNELLADIYNSANSFEFLRDIDGCYAAVLYDKEEDKVFLITDRYGFKPLYWGTINNDLVWSSEVKGFLGHMDFKPVIDLQAVKEFFGIGYLLENRTWFEGIELVPPASFLAFDLKKSKIEIKQYWSWNEIKTIKGYIDEGEIVEELGRLLKKAVSRRVNGERICVPISGGLDSRAIFAAVPEDYKPLHTFTYGRKGCDDIKIARQVSMVKGAIHHILELDSSNWLMPRISSVWKSDGVLNLLHVHGGGFYDKYKSCADFILTGFFGGEIIGGQLVGINKPMEYKVRNTGRRFGNSGLIVGESYFIVRRPYFDNNLSNLIFSIPEKSTFSIYRKMLLRSFPQFYNTIPYEKIGFPISYPIQIIKIAKFKNRIIRRLKHESLKFGVRFKDTKGYTDYALWIRREPARSFFEKLLMNKNAMYPEYVDKNKVYTYLTDHMERKANYHDELSLFLTFELWLQQVFEEKYRVAPEETRSRQAPFKEMTRT
ncbi:MAG: asparagine synthase-related protein [Candidatus Tritonobacter lacicola]|nr:asparagine synthase-related protein [Candidatus Tritonobacter lacicola]